MSARRQHKYKGILATPPKRPLLLASAANPDDAELAARAHAEGQEAFAERYIALCQDCGVEPNAKNAPIHVALTLAERHVPGFRLEIPKKKGAPKHSWKKVARDYVIFQQVSVLVSKGQSIRSAATIVSRKDRALGSAAAVDSRYRRAAKGLETDNSLRAGFWMIAEHAIAQKLKAYLQVEGEDEYNREMGTKLLSWLQSSKSPEQRARLMVELNEAPPALRQYLGDE